MDAMHTMWPDEDNPCDGHPAGPFDPMGETVYCDGSCKPKSLPTASERIRDAREAR